jgi:hypothetical protein
VVLSATFLVTIANNIDKLVSNDLLFRVRASLMFADAAFVGQEYARMAP